MYNLSKIKYRYTPSMDELIQILIINQEDKENIIEHTKRFKQFVFLKIQKRQIFFLIHHKYKGTLRCIRYCRPRWDQG